MLGVIADQISSWSHLSGTKVNAAKSPSVLVAIEVVCNVIDAEPSERTVAKARTFSRKIDAQICSAWRSSSSRGKVHEALSQIEMSLAVAIRAQ